MVIFRLTFTHNISYDLSHQTEGSEVNVLKKYMEQHGLTQKELARRVQISQAAVSKHTHGMGMSLETALRYSKALGIPVEQLRNKSQED